MLFGTFSFPFPYSRLWSNTTHHWLLRLYPTNYLGSVIVTPSITVATTVPLIAFQVHRGADEVYIVRTAKKAITLLPGGTAFYLMRGKQGNN